MSLPYGANKKNDRDRIQIVFVCVASIIMLAAGFALMENSQIYEVRSPSVMVSTDITKRRLQSFIEVAYEVVGENDECLNLNVSRMECEQAAKQLHKSSVDLKTISSDWIKPTCFFTEIHSQNKDGSWGIIKNFMFNKKGSQGYLGNVKCRGWKETAKGYHPIKECLCKRLREDHITRAVPGTESVHVNENELPESEIIAHNTIVSQEEISSSLSEAGH